MKMAYPESAQAPSQKSPAHQTECQVRTRNAQLRERPAPAQPGTAARARAAATQKKKKRQRLRKNVCEVEKHMRKLCLQALRLCVDKGRTSSSARCCGCRQSFAGKRCAVCKVLRTTSARRCACRQSGLHVVACRQIGLQVPAHCLQAQSLQLHARSLRPHTLVA